MPIYEFRCPSCGAVREEIRAVGDTGRGLKCEACGAESLERIPSTFAASGGAKGSGAACGPSGFS